MAQMPETKKEKIATTSPPAALGGHWLKRNKKRKTKKGTAERKQKKRKKGNAENRKRGQCRKRKKRKRGLCRNKKRKKKIEVKSPEKRAVPLKTTYVYIYIYIYVDVYIYIYV